ncbi:transcription factor CP2 [Onthophagus taurus]|uniref:transcription factor CP2 n=1 Tax=Onthophagus taurus TaxID=166361 RepID=UPI000C20AD6F|nr:transcription factor CP2 [Onthophagus taurus]XP_022915334.1 transcription factor CP2 [Onthophagus taurus]
MDFQIYENAEIIVEDGVEKNNWNLAIDVNMENEEYFNWTNGLKIDESQFGGGKNSRKRKPEHTVPETTKIKATAVKVLKTADSNNHQNSSRKVDSQSGPSRMPQWQVDDITDLNADIEGLGSELSNTSYNMSDSILSISGLTVFKQEAPSPPISNDVNTIHITRQNNTVPVTTQGTVITSGNSISDSNAIINTTLHQLLGQAGYNTGLQTSIENSLIPSSPTLSQDGFGVVSSASTIGEDCRFQYVLAAATSIATKVNEDTLTYLNQGQSYEIKLKKLGDLSTYRGKLLKSVIKICFHERRLQYMEKEQMKLWQNARPGDKILEVDIPLSYGLCNIVQTGLNTVHFNWDPTKEVGVYIKVNCISTEFTAKKHGGEKGVPFRIQVETYQGAEGSETPKRLHAAVCQIKVFKLKGADRKHKQDRDKIMKRPAAEQEKFQPSYECTVLTDISCESLNSFSPVTSYTNECSPPAKPYILPIENSPKNEIIAPPSPPSPKVTNNVINDPSPPPVPVVDDSKSSDFLLDVSTPEQTLRWLTTNRFDKYINIFSSFSGADMLRMSREDLIQICGQADGIRLYNALHVKAIAPKLTIYVSLEHTKIFNAVFLSNYSSNELIQKLAGMLGVGADKIRNVYVQGPQAIHILLSNDVISRFKEESMFNLDVLQENESYVILLKPASK